ncbi:hypothetical protein ACFL5Z_19170 [Planctomycetota bacterium]
MIIGEYYHAEILYAGLSGFVLNRTKDEIINRVLVPFVTKQVIPLLLGKRRSFINMGAVSSILLYKSTDQLGEADFNFNEPELAKFDECTAELIEEVRTLIANPDIKSFLQLAFTEPNDQMFVIMKFGDKQLDSAYSGVICPLAAKYGLKALRIDEIQDSNKIDEQILEHIAKSKIILSDLTGSRPNCYYETGFSYALGKEVILTIKKGEPRHFDLSTNRFIEWETENELRINLEKRLIAVTNRLATIAEGAKGVVP